MNVDNGSAAYSVPRPIMIALRAAIMRAGARTVSDSSEFPANLTIDDFCKDIVRSRLIGSAELAMLLARHCDAINQRSASAFAEFLQDGGYLTPWQCYKLSTGRVRGYFVAQYRLLYPLGYGTVSDVYAARHTVLDFDVALAILRPERAADIELDRWKERLRISSRLENPLLLRVTDAGLTANFRYHVRDLVLGHTFRELLELRPSLPLSGIVALTAQFADAISGLRGFPDILRSLSSGDVLIDGAGYLHVNPTQVSALLSPGTAPREGLDVLAFLDALLPLADTGESAHASRGDESSSLSSSPRNLLHRKLLGWADDRRHDTGIDPSAARIDLLQLLDGA